MKLVTIFLMTLLATATTANAAGYSLQPFNPHPLPLTFKPDLTPSLRPVPSAPKPVMRQAAVASCGLSDFYVGCAQR